MSKAKKTKGPKWNRGRTRGRICKLHKARRRREARRHVEHGVPRLRSMTHPQHPQPAYGRVTRNITESRAGSGYCGRPYCQRKAQVELRYEHYHRGRWKVASPRKRCARHAKRFVSKHA